MITLQAITGLLIAAVLNVLGTGQREVAKVENEPVASVVGNMVMPEWFEYDGPEYGETNYNPNLATNYKPYTGSTDPDCDDGEQVCAVKLPRETGTGHPQQGALTAISGDISAGEPVEDLLLFEPAP